MTEESEISQHARALGSIVTPKKSAACRQNIARARQVLAERGGHTEETRAKLRIAQQRRRRAERVARGLPEEEAKVPGRPVGRPRVHPERPLRTKRGRPRKDEVAP